jgi:hypothetical protein
MPSYCYRRQLAPSEIKQNLADVKVRLITELKNRTDERVKYWDTREAWCREKPGRVLIIGWDNDAPHMREMAGPENVNSVKQQCSSCIEIPD